MQVPFTAKALGSIFVLAAILVVLLFFAARFAGEDMTADSEQSATGRDQTAASHVAPAAIDTSTRSESATDSQAQEPPEPPPDRTVKDLVNKWNQGSAEDIAGLFVSDGTLIVPSGSEIRSREEIKKTISEKRAGALKETTLSNTVEKVSRPDPETAVVQGTYKIEGIKILGFNTTAAGTYSLQQIRRNGRWLISRAEVKKQDDKG